MLIVNTLASIKLHVETVVVVPLVAGLIQLNLPDASGALFGFIGAVILVLAMLIADMYPTFQKEKVKALVIVSPLIIAVGSLAAWIFTEGILDYLPTVPSGMRVTLETFIGMVAWKGVPLITKLWEKWVINQANKRGL